MRTFILVLIAFFSLVTASQVSALELPKINFPFPSIKPFPLMSPKPSLNPQPSIGPSMTPKPSVTPAPALFEITEVDPSSGDFMDEVTIYGSHFGNSTGAVNFRQSNQSFSSGSAPVVLWTDTQILVKVPAVAKGSYRVQVVRADGQKSNEEKFSVRNGQPVINSNSIVVRDGEIEMTFIGKEFGRRGSIDIYDGSTFAGHGILRSWSSSRIRFDFPNLPRKQYGFQITTADGRKSSLKFFTVGN